MTQAERNCVEAVAAHVEAVQDKVQEVYAIANASRAAIEGIRLDVERLTGKVEHMHTPITCTMAPRMAHTEAKAQALDVRLANLETDRIRILAAIGGIRWMVAAAVTIVGLLPYLYRAWEAGLFPAPGK